MRLRELLPENEDDDTYYHVTHTKNLKNIQANGLIPKVGPRSKKLGEKPSTFLFKHRDDADNAMMNWMGDEMGDKPTSLLTLKIPKTVKVHQTSAGFEHQTFDPIHPKHIHKVEDF